MDIIVIGLHIINQCCRKSQFISDNIMTSTPYLVPIYDKYINKSLHNTVVFLTLLLLPLTTQSAIILNSTPLTISTHRPTNWDINNDTITDFIFGIRDKHLNEGLLELFQGRITFPDTGTGQAILIKEIYDNRAPLGFDIGPNLKTNYTWKKNETYEHLLLFTNTRQFLGFRFSSNNQLFYGWADIILGNNINHTITINQWAYQDDGSNIKVGEGGDLSFVPLPPSILLMLGGLAMGAGGALRNRKIHSKSLTV